MPLLPREREELSSFLVSNWEQFEKEQCVNCYYFSDGCTADDCPGRAVSSKEEARELRIQERMRRAS
jgi:hypothetical protein